VVLVHAIAPDRAEELWARVQERVEVRERIVAPIGPIVGSHVGPGAIGIAAVPSAR
jgi:fatty acid-binding protein DegV